MKVYIYFVILITIIYIFSKYLNKQINYLYAVISIFIFGQRWGSGVDFPGYLNYYLINFKREYLYTLLQETVIKYDLNFGIIIFFVYSLTTILFIYFINKMADNSNEIIYFFFLSEIHFALMSQIRNWLAVGFFLCAYYNYKIEKRKRLALIMIALGYGFHRSILFVFPCIFFVKSLTKNIKGVLILLSLLISCIDFKFILSIFSKFHYIGYLFSEFNQPLSLINKGKFLILVFIYIIYYLTENRNKKTEKDKIIEIGAYIYLITYAISLNMGMFLRISHYFKIFEILYLIEMLKYTKISKIKIMPVIYFYGYFLGCLLTNAYGYSQYEFKMLKIYRDVPKEYYIEYLNKLNL